MKERTKTFEKLVEEKATCLEFAWHGYIRIHEEGAKKCKCQSCLALDTLDTKGRMKR